MASVPITSWQIDRENVEMVRFHLLGSKINVGNDCSHEIKWHLLLGRIAMTNLDNVLKSRDITLLTKISIVKAVVFPVVLYGCERWTIKRTFCSPLDWRPPGSSVHGISQARRLEGGAISFSKGSSRPRDQTHISCIGRWILRHRATRGKDGAQL